MVTMETANNLFYLNENERKSQKNLKRKDTTKRQARKDLPSTIRDWPHRGYPCADLRERFHHILLDEFEFLQFREVLLHGPHFRVVHQHQQIHVRQRRRLAHEESRICALGDFVQRLKREVPTI